MQGTKYKGVVWQKVITAVVPVMLCGSLAFAASPKIAKDLRGKAPSDQVNVIVQFTQTPTATHHQKVLRNGGTLNRELCLINGASYSVPAAALSALAADPEVAYISPERPVFTTNNGSPTAVLDYHTRKSMASSFAD